MTGCFPENKVVTIKEELIELEVASIVKAASISVIKMSGSLRIVTVIDNTISTMDKESADKLALQIVKVSSSGADDINGVSIMLKEKNEGMPKYIYNWSFKENKFVPVIQRT
jgi:hypothetical protein